VSAAARLAGFAAALAVVFAAAVGIGNAVGPDGTPGGGTADQGGHADAPGSSGVDAPGTQTDAAVPVKGLSVSQDGYTLVLDAATHPVGTVAPLTFAITGPQGRPVTAFTPTHDRDLHLIVVRRDMTGYQHLHPKRDGEGRWTVPLVLDEAGVYKVFADFAPDGRTDALTLAADLSASGRYEPQPLPGAAATTAVGDYTVSLDGDLVPGQESTLTLSLARDRRPVTDLQPYLGAYGHLVALRAGDLAYLHVHPEGTPGDGRTTAGPDISFDVGVPTAGVYRLYLDFQHDGVVRTAVLTATAHSASRTPAVHEGGTAHH
jgi:hypothetical protein